MKSEKKDKTQTVQFITNFVEEDIYKKDESEITERNKLNGYRTSLKDIS